MKSSTLVLQAKPLTPQIWDAYKRRPKYNPRSQKSRPTYFWVTHRIREMPRNDTIYWACDFCNTMVYGKSLPSNQDSLFISICTVCYESQETNSHETLPC
jgi:hypothetical protein